MKWLYDYMMINLINDYMIIYLVIGKTSTSSQRFTVFFAFQGAEVVEQRPDAADGWWGLHKRAAVLGSSHRKNADFGKGMKSWENMF